MHQQAHRTLKPSYIVSELIAEVGCPAIVGQQLVKPSMKACAIELLDNDAANVLMKITLSNDTVRRRQDEMGEQLRIQLVEKLKNVKFSLQLDEATIHNSALLLSYVRYFDISGIHEEMLFIMFLKTDSTGETIFHTFKTYFDDLKIPISN